MTKMWNFKSPFHSIFVFALFVVCHGEDEKIDNLSAIESISKMVLLKHHPESLYANADNVTESFALFLQNLYKQNFTDEQLNLNCSSLDELSHLPKNLCSSGSLSKCLSASDMLKLIPATKTMSETLARLCPLLLLQLHHGACTSENLEKPSSYRPSTVAVWGYGMLFVTIISCCSLVGVVLLPLLSKSVYQTVLMLFEGLAVGSLVGSSLFHLIPQTFKLVGQDEEHNYLWRSLLIFGGIYLFYLSERFMKMIMDVKKNRKKKTVYEINENSTEFLKPPPEFSNPVANGSDPHCKGDNKLTNGTLHILTAENLNHSNYKLMDEFSLNKSPSKDIEITHAHHSHHEHAIHFEKGQSAIGTVAWMIIFGDGLHNFIDGLSIGAAFSESILAGISISMAVICEEFPHELGDFAVLLSAGMTMRQALLYNFLSAITCYVGLVIGILLGDLAEGAPYIFALAAGMFLYISLVDMMGELSEVLEEARKKGIREQMRVLFIQNIGIILGVAILFAMARYQEHFNFQNFGALVTGSSSTDDYSDDTVKQFYSGIQEAKNMHSLLTN